jgi:hypothetical protein
LTRARLWAGVRPVGKPLRLEHLQVLVEKGKALEHSLRTKSLRAQYGKPKYQTKSLNAPAQPEHKG